MLAERNCALAGRIGETEGRLARLERAVPRNPVVTAAVTRFEEHTGACPCGRLRAASSAGASEAGMVIYNQPCCANPSRDLENAAQAYPGRLPECHRYPVRGYASTAARHGQNMITVSRGALASDPWTPAISA